MVNEVRRNWVPLDQSNKGGRNKSLDKKKKSRKRRPSLSSLKKKKT